MRDSIPTLLNQLANTTISDDSSPALAWENKGGEISTLTKYFEARFNGKALIAEDILLAGLLLQIITIKWPNSTKINKLAIILAKQNMVSLVDLSNLKTTNDRVFSSSPFAILSDTLLLLRELYENNDKTYAKTLLREDYLSNELTSRRTATLARTLAESIVSDDTSTDSMESDLEFEDERKFVSLRSTLIDTQLELMSKVYVHDILSDAFKRLNSELNSVLRILNQSSSNPHAKEYIRFLINYPLTNHMSAEAYVYLLCTIVVLAAELNDTATFSTVMQHILYFLKSQANTNHKKIVINQLSQSLSSAQLIEFSKMLNTDLAETKSDKRKSQYSVEALMLLYRYGFANHNRRHLEAQAKAFMRFVSSPCGSMSDEAIASRSTTPSMDSLSGAQSALISAQVLNWIHGDTSITEEKILGILASYDFEDPATFAEISSEIQSKIKDFIMRITANTVAISTNERQAVVISKHYIKCSDLELERYVRDATNGSDPIKLLIQTGNKSKEPLFAHAFICISRAENGMYEVYNPSAPYGSLRFTDTQSILQFTRAALFGFREESCGLHALTGYIRSLFPANTRVLKITHYAGYRQRQTTLHDRAQTPTEGITGKLPSIVPLVRVQSVPVQQLSQTELASIDKANSIREKVRTGQPVTTLIAASESPYTRPMGSPFLSAFNGKQRKPRAIPGEGTEPAHIQPVVINDEIAMPYLGLDSM